MQTGPGDAMSVMLMRLSRTQRREIFQAFTGTIARKRSGADDIRKIECRPDDYNFTMCRPVTY